MGADWTGPWSDVFEKTRQVAAAGSAQMGQIDLRTTQRTKDADTLVLDLLFPLGRLAHVLPEILRFTQTYGVPALCDVIAKAWPMETRE